jgi:transcriptional regulator with XRE-family HTH domain
MSKKLIDSQMIGKSIKSLREANNLTQVALAEKIGYSVRNLRRIEKDGTTKIDVVNTFACAFEVSALDILNGDVFFLPKNKKNIVDLRHTTLTLICYSYTCTLG